MTQAGEMIRKKLFQEVEDLAQKAIILSDDLGKNPEIGEQEFESSRKHVELLRQAGYEVEYPLAGIPTAFIARKGSCRPKVALLVEYDALPVIGHACGHNVSGSMSTLAGLALAAVADEFTGQVLVIGTPAEETNGAKVKMSEEGIFDELDLAMMLHSSGGISFVHYDCLAMDAIEFTFRGKTSHAAASPWAGRNALNGVQLMFHAIDMLRQHVIPDIRMHGIIPAGGEAPNIVPELAKARFYFRAPKRSIVDEVVGKALNCARGAALATETDVSWEKFEASFDDMLPNVPAEEAMSSIMEELGIDLSSSPGFQGSSDIGNVSYRCPTLQPMFAITDEPLTLHTREFAEATTLPGSHRAIVSGAKALAAMAHMVLTDGSLRKAIKEAFVKEREGVPKK